MNTRLSKMSVQCEICFRTYSSARNLRRHKQNTHRVYPQVKPFLCSYCDFENTSLVAIKNHFSQKHGHIIVNHCCYCNIVFENSAKSLNHAEIFHSLPTQITQKEHVDIERSRGYEKIETAFRGLLQTYQLKQKITSIDLLELLGEEKSRMQNLIREKTRDGPKKFELTIEKKLVKPRLKEGSQETITIFTNTDCVPVYSLEFRTMSFFVSLNNLLRPCTPLHCMAVDGFCWKYKTCL